MSFVFGGFDYDKLKEKFEEVMDYRTSDLLKSVRVWDVKSHPAIDEINLYAFITSDSTEDTVLQVVSGSGTNTDTTYYLGSNKMAWIESCGLEVEFSASPDITWNNGKYIRLQFKRTQFGSSGSNSYEARFGGLNDSADNFRQLTALSESVHYMTSNKIIGGKDHARYDLIAMGNLRYWFVNSNGDEYIKLVADAGIFTWSSDKPMLFMKGYVFDLDEILAV
ncbi:MAG: hypothetical protein ACTSR0_04025 [Candidatus Asgardarchaeia archaeon]